MIRKLDIQNIQRPNAHSSLIPIRREYTTHGTFYRREKTSTWQYIVACPSTKAAVIIDPVLDFNQGKLNVSPESA